MQLTNLSRKVLTGIVLTAVMIEIVIPNILVRLFFIPILRPTLFAFNIFLFGILMILGLLSEYFRIRYDEAYGSIKNNRLRFFIIGPIAVLIILFVFVQSYLISADISYHFLNRQPYRTMQATITNRTGLPGAFIVGDSLVLDGTTQITLPYSNLPTVGEKYIFTLLPTKNIVVDYKPLGDQ